MQDTPSQLTGDESILPGATVRDFWAWALGDLRMNSTRGMLAQFLVAKAAGDTRASDDGWGAFDVLSSSGLKIEVKSSGYLQSWFQPRISRISFSGLITSRWNPDTAIYTSPQVIADVYVFAVQTCIEPTQYDPLRLEDWDFYVIPGSVIAERGQNSMRLSTVRAIAGDPVPWSELPSTIECA